MRHHHRLKTTENSWNVITSRHCSCFQVSTPPKRELQNWREIEKGFGIVVLNVPGKSSMDLIHCSVGFRCYGSLTVLSPLSLSLSFSSSSKHDSGRQVHVPVLLPPDVHDNGRRVDRVPAGDRVCQVGWRKERRVADIYREQRFRGRPSISLVWINLWLCVT